MAKFGIEATQLSDPSLGAAKFVKQPVQDNSANVLLGTALGLAGEAYTGYQLASLEQEQEDVVNEYIESKKNPAIAAEAQMDIGALDAAEESLWKRVSSDSSYAPDAQDFTGIQRSLDEKLTKLRNAKEQGIMSPDEFANRILATTREAVARNPGLYNELVQHSSRMLDLSGITDIVKADAKRIEDAQKQADTIKQNIISLAGKHDVPTYTTQSGEVDYARIKTEVEQIQKQKQLVTIAENFGKLDSEQKKQQGRDFMASGNGIELMNGKISQLNSQAALLLNEGGDVTGALTQMRLMGESAYQQYFQMLSPIVADSPAAKEALDYFRKQIDVSISFMEKASSKEDALKRSNALTTILKNSQYQEATKLVNPEVLDITTKVLNTIGAPRILEKNDALMGQMVNTFSDLLSGVSGSPRVNYDASVQGKNVVSQGMVALAKEAVEDPRAVGRFGKAIASIAQDVQNPDKFATVEQKYKFYEKLVRDLGDPSVKAGLSKVGVDSISQATGMVDDYMNLTIPDMWKSIRNWENKGVIIEMDVLPDGRTVFKTSNPQATQDMNTRYSPRINDSLHTMSNLMGLDSKSVAVNQFYPQYLPQFADDPDLQPKNMRPEIDRALREGRITQEQYNQLVAP